MGCEPIYTNGNVTGFMCSIGRKERLRCYICGKPATKLCDHREKEGTCDRPMCKEHTHHIGKDTDLCAEHNEVYKKNNAEPEQVSFLNGES